MLVGNIDKMRTELAQNGQTALAQYFFTLTNGNSSQEQEMNSALGKKIRIKFSGEIHCANCLAKTKKSYSGGYCFKCSIKLAECDMCILKPETCHFAKGTCREPEWGEKNCNIDHYIYLSNSSGLKVGITRTTQVPTRFIDQGATWALPVIKVKSRFHSGLIEKMFSQEINDKTNFRQMLSGVPEEIDLFEKRDELFELFGDELDQFENDWGKNSLEILDNEEMIKIDYPILEYPKKIVSKTLDKLDESGELAGVLKGIKGQYLILDSCVFNVRNHTSYKIELEII